MDKLAVSMEEETRKAVATAAKAIGAELEQAELLGMLGNLPEVGGAAAADLMLVLLILEPMECKVQ